MTTLTYTHMHAPCMHVHAQHTLHNTDTLHTSHSPDLVDLKLSVEGDDVIRSILLVLVRWLDTLDVDGDLPINILDDPVGELTRNKTPQVIN